MIPIQWLWPERWERRRYDRDSSVVFFFCVVLFILTLLLFFLFIWIGTTPIFALICFILVPVIFMLLVIFFSLHRADRRRKAALRAQSYRKDQYPARYPFSGRRIDRDSDQEEIGSLQARIAELEEQLATVKKQRSSTVSVVPDVVEFVEMEGRKKVPEPKDDGLQREQRLLREEWKAEKAAIDVLISALDEAMARGAISEEEYLRKQKKYQKELQNLDKKLQSFSKKT
ncbi:MAG: hypothetical protein ACFFAL_06465 [Promethearchaeota archaeon]